VLVRTQIHRPPCVSHLPPASIASSEGEKDVQVVKVYRGASGDGAIEKVCDSFYGKLWQLAGQTTPHLWYTSLGLVTVRCVMPSLPPLWVSLGLVTRNRPLSPRFGSVQSPRLVRTLEAQVHHGLPCVGPCYAP
jgi:hypothetical protein